MTSDPQATVRMDMSVLGGRYRLESVVASGGVATVVQATDLLLDRPVAVKLLKEATDCDEDRARFLLETRTLARLSHPGLVTMLDAGTDADRPYLVMELVDGPSLSSLLGRPLDLARAADIGAQIARALDYAHAQGVVHRDVKPGNVLLRSDGRVKLADFGIARLVGQRSEYTRTGVVVGSVHYLAPEQVAFEDITPAVDVYALGLLLLRAVTGSHAFDGSTIETALARLTAAPPVPDSLPAGWRALLTAMTVRAAADRPTAAEVAERLVLLPTVSAPARVLPPPPAAPAPVAVRPARGPARARGPLRDRRVAALAASAALVAAALVLASILFGGPAPGDGAGVAEAAGSGADTVVPSPTAEAESVEVEAVADVSTASTKPVRRTASNAGTRSGRAGQASHSQHQKPKHHKPKHHGKPGKGKPGKGKPGKGKH